MSTPRISIKKMTVLAMFTAISLVIFVLESYIPLPVPIPGIKLGLANIITLILLSLYKPQDAAMVLFCRIFLGSLFTGQLVTFFYSLCGGIACLLIMSITNRIYRGRFLVLTSIFGAIAHNLGQIALAYFVLQSIGVFAYLPFLILSAIVTGTFTGLCAHFFKKHIEKLIRSSGSFRPTLP